MWILLYQTFWSERKLFVFLRHHVPSAEKRSPTHKVSIDDSLRHRRCCTIFHIFCETEKTSQKTRRYFPSWTFGFAGTEGENCHLQITQHDKWARTLTFPLFSPFLQLLMKRWLAIQSRNWHKNSSFFSSSSPSSRRAFSINLADKTIATMKKFNNAAPTLSCYWLSGPKNTDILELFWKWITQNAELGIKIINYTHRQALKKREAQNVNHTHNFYWLRAAGRKTDHKSSYLFVFIRSQSITTTPR